MTAASRYSRNLRRDSLFVRCKINCKWGRHRAESVSLSGSLTCLTLVRIDATVWSSTAQRTSQTGQFDSRSGEEKVHCAAPSATRERKWVAVRFNNAGYAVQTPRGEAICS